MCDVRVKKDKREADRNKKQKKEEKRKSYQEIIWREKTSGWHLLRV